MKFSLIAIVAFVGAVAATECSRFQFSWESGRTGKCCLPKGGNPQPPSCPSTKECPHTWEWHGFFGCCVPKDTAPPSHLSPPGCPSGGPFDHDQQCCHKPAPPSPPPPNPSHRPRSDAGHGKLGARSLASRNWRSKTVSCPAGQSICNVSDGLTKSNTWACVDTQKDVNFCGGCGTSSDAGMDCSAIPFSWNTACSAGKCSVLTCEPGYYVGRDGTSCHAL